MSASDEIIIGERNAWGAEWERFGIAHKDRLQHMLVIGMSGAGKSTLLENMAVQDIESGRGLAFLDPHGASIAKILPRIPSNRIEDVVFFNAGDARFPVSFNIFEGVSAESRHLVASGIVEAFKGIWSESWGPRLEYILYAAVAAVLECKNVSILSIQRMLTDEVYRMWIVKQVKDPAVRSFWNHEFAGYDKRFVAEAVAPIQNKIGQVVMSPVLRNILGQVNSDEDSRVNVRRIMDTQKIFLVDLSKGKLGADKSALLGALLISQFQVAAMSRMDRDTLEDEADPENNVVLPEEPLPDFTVYADEFHSYASDSVAATLSESRKYGLALVAGAQYLAQLRQRVLSAVLGNVGSIVSFRVGYEDAAALERACGDSARASDLTILNNWEVCARILSAGRSLPAFFGKTLPPWGNLHNHVKTIVDRSRERFARPKAEVERRILQWYDDTGEAAKAADPKKDRRPASSARRFDARQSREGPPERIALLG
ncbi:type IV secretory system conjugative DNA transfer family protein [Oleiharenicola lentus]|uniref:type IV secretory system conjugative DNA transfer family protein n=1 Tax=Oleiharenicola lentus TaxID=2508720 RepID=UPI003F66B964